MTDEPNAQPLTDKQLDALLDTEQARFQAHRATPGLQTRILARAVAKPDPWDNLVGWLRGAVWRPTAVLLAPLMLGVIIGATQPLTADEDAIYLSDYPWVELQEDVIDE